MREIFLVVFLAIATAITAWSLYDIAERLVAEAQRVVTHRLGGDPPISGEKE
jgi:hypothetical protein